MASKRSACTTIRIGTRGSPLALWQASWVRRALGRVFPNRQFIEEIIRTTGDIQREQPLAAMGGRGVFVRELDQALLDGRIDLAVHSAKDYPTDVPECLVIAAYPARQAANDSLVGRRGERLGDLPPAALVGTGSLRRAAQLLGLRPDLRFAQIRGNIETRLRKLREGRYDAIIMAEAALRRLRLDHVVRHVLPIAQLVPDAGQGALMVVCRRNDRRVRRMAARINRARIERCVAAEREVLRRLGGGCSLPVGVYAKIIGDRIRLRAVAVSPDGSRHVAVIVEEAATQPQRAARRAVEQLLRGGAGEILKQLESDQRA